MSFHKTKAFSAKKDNKKKFLMNNIPDPNIMMKIIQLAIENINREGKITDIGFIYQTIQGYDTPFSKFMASFGFKGWNEVLKKGDEEGWFLIRKRKSSFILIMNKKKYI